MTSKIIVAIVAIVAVFAGCGGDSPVGPTTRTDDPTTPITDPVPPAAPQYAPASIANTTIAFDFDDSPRCLAGTLGDDDFFSDEVLVFGPDGRVASVGGETIAEIIEEARQEGIVLRLSISYSRLNANRARLTVRSSASGAENGSAEGTYDMTFDGSSRGQFTLTVHFRGDADITECARLSQSGTFELRRN